MNKQIEELLSGAINAALATAYAKMKNSFDGPIKYASRLFLVCIGALVLVSLILSIGEIGLFHIKFINISDWDAVLKSIIYKLPFYAPIVWLAFYATKRRSEYQRLQQEYAHKEALASSYQSFKEQLEQLDDDDNNMQKALILKAVEAIAFNASATLDRKHGDKMPVQSAIEQVLSKKT